MNVGGKHTFLTIPASTGHKKRLSCEDGHLQTYFDSEKINNNSSYRLYNIFIGGPQTC